MRTVGAWHLDVNDTYRSRIDDGDVVFWKPGRTIFCASWTRPPRSESLQDQLAALLRDANPSRKAILEYEKGGVLRHAYLLREPEEEGGHRWMLHGFTLSAGSYFQLGICFDLKRDLDWARAVAESVVPAGKGGRMKSVVKDTLGAEGWMALASKRVIGPRRAAILYGYCEAPDRESDSGWRFLRGDETQEFLDDSANVQAVSLSELLKMEPALRQLVVDESAGAWKRASKRARWRPATD